MLYPYVACRHSVATAPIPGSALPWPPADDLPTSFWLVQVIATVFMVLATVMAIRSASKAADANARRASLLAALVTVVAVLGIFAVQGYGGAGSPQITFTVSSLGVDWYLSAIGEHFMTLLIGVGVLWVTVALGYLLPGHTVVRGLGIATMAMWAVLAAGWLALTIAGYVCA